MTAPHMVDRVGTIHVEIPKLRQGTYFPEWLLERRKRAESALITVVDEWTEGRRYLGVDILAKSRLTLIPGTGSEVNTDTVLELSA